MVVDQLYALPNEAVRLTSERCMMWIYRGSGTRKPINHFHVYDLPRFFTEINSHGDGPDDPDRDKCDLDSYDYMGIKEKTTPYHEGTNMQMNFHLIGECKVRKIWPSDAYSPNTLLCIQFQKAPYSKATTKLKDYNGNPLTCPRTWYWKMRLPFCRTFSEIIPQWLEACQNFRLTLSQFPAQFFEYGIDHERPARIDQLVKSIEFPSGRPPGKDDGPDHLRHSGRWYVIGYYHYTDMQQDTGRPTEFIEPLYKTTDGRKLSGRAEDSLPFHLHGTTRQGYYSKPYIQIWSGPDGVYDPVTLGQLRGPYFDLVPSWEETRDGLIREVRKQFGDFQEKIDVALLSAATEARNVARAAEEEDARNASGARWSGAVRRVDVVKLTMQYAQEKTKAIKVRFLARIQKMFPQIAWPLITDQETVAEMVREPVAPEGPRGDFLGPSVGMAAQPDGPPERLGGRKRKERGRSPGPIVVEEVDPSERDAAAATAAEGGGSADGGHDSSGVGLFSPFRASSRRASPAPDSRDEGIHEQPPNAGRRSQSRQGSRASTPVPPSSGKSKHGSKKKKQAND